MQEAIALVTQYYEAFNHQNTGAMLECVTDTLVHEVNQGETRVGKQVFSAFLDHMNSRYHEQISDLVVMASNDGTRAAAEFHLDGKYLMTDEGLPEADGQTYSLRVGAFFELEGGKISRVSTHYNLSHWTQQVVGNA